MKIPFKFLPASWGLKGKTREIAEAEYYLTGYELDKKLAEINCRGNDEAVARALLKVDRDYCKISQREYDNEMAHRNFNGKDREAELLRIQWAHGDITEYDYKVAVAKLYVAEGEDLDMELAEIDLDMGKITQQEFNKRKATILKQPYISIIDSDYKPEEKLNGLYFEFDWNEYWIEELKANGYVGFTDDQIVQRWFEDLCKSVVAESSATDDDQPVPFNSSRIINQVRRDGGPTEYS